MRRTFITLAAAMLFLGAGPAAPAAAQDLWIGDAAPALDGTRWFNGDPVSLEQARDKKVVVVEFWATWCGPCIASMPHLTDVQQKYADRDVVVIGVTKPDPNNSLEQVEAFVKKNPQRMGYRVAFDGDKKTFDAYMKAAGQNGIPTAFIVDRTGTVAWIGHPMNMDEPLAAIVAGTHDVQMTRLTLSIQKRARDMSVAGKYDQAEHAYEALAALEPESPTPWSSLAYMYAYNLNWPGKTREASIQAVERGRDNATFLASFADFLSGRDEVYRCADLALRAARRAMALEPDSIDANSALVRALMATDATDEARAVAQKAVDGFRGDADALARLASLFASEDVGFVELAVSAARHAVELDPESSDRNITLIRVLASAGNADDAMTVARKAIDLLKDDPSGLARLANTLARPELEGRCGALALEAIGAALAAEPDDLGHLRTQFRILALCQKDENKANAIGAYAVEQAEDNAGFLNNFAWSLLTEDGLKGHFNELALAASQRCHELTEGENWMYLDTLALAKFETGARREAAELETKALELAKEKGVIGGSLSDLEEALERFQGTETETETATP